MTQILMRALVTAAFSLMLLSFWTDASLGSPLAGDHEIEVAGGLFHAQDSDTGALNADIAYGYYLTPGWQLALRQALNYNFIDDKRDVWTATTAPVLNYHFHFSDRVLPFVGGFIGAVWNDRDATGTLGPNAGLKVFLTDQTYLGLRYRYEWFFDRIKTIDDNASHGNHVFNIGLGFVWGGARKP